jgi:hypothetical protein
MKKTTHKIKKAEVQEGNNLQVLVRVRPFNQKEKKKSKVNSLLIFY